jgi:hypothetical protein
VSEEDSAELLWEALLGMPMALLNNQCPYINHIPTQTYLCSINFLGPKVYMILLTELVNITKQYFGTINHV